MQENNTKLNKIAAYASFVTLAIAFVAIVIITFWLSFPYKPATFNSIKVLEEKVDSGSSLTYEIDYCKNMSIPAQVTRSFVNGVIFTTNTITTNNQTGCHKNLTMITIPQEMASGPYTLRTTWTYKVNPMREISVTKDSNKFEIEGSDKARQEKQ